MKLEEFYKLISTKMEVLGKAREESYNKLYFQLEGIPPNDSTLPEIAMMVTENEKNLQDMMKVMNTVVDQQLEAYSSVNSFAVDLAKKKQESKHMNGRSKVTFMDESSEESRDTTYTIEDGPMQKAGDANGATVKSNTNQENRPVKLHIFPPQMPVSPVFLSSTVNSSVLNSANRSISATPYRHHQMPVTPPTINRSACYLHPKVLNFDETLDAS